MRVVLVTMAAIVWVIPRGAKAFRAVRTDVILQKRVRHPGEELQIIFRQLVVEIRRSYRGWRGFRRSRSIYPVSFIHVAKFHKPVEIKFLFFM